MAEIPKVPKIWFENTSNIVMALLIVSIGFPIASLTSEKYAILDGAKQYGIFGGASGGSGCLGQCQVSEASSEDGVCTKDEWVCLLFKVPPVLIAIFSFVTFFLIPINFTNPTSAVAKNTAIVVFLSLAFAISIIAFLIQILVPVIDGRSLLDLHTDGKISWSEGFSLSVITIASTGMTLLLYIFNIFKPT